LVGGKLPVTPVAKEIVGKPDQVPSPLQKVLAEAEIPLPKLATGKLPVTPVDKGNPVKLVATPLEGVPKAGVTRTQEVVKQKEPEPETANPKAVETPVPKEARIFNCAPVALTEVAPRINGVGIITVPVNVGLAIVAFKFKAACKSVWLDKVPVIAPHTAPPPPGGAAQVPSPRQNVEDEAPAPLFKFPTGKLPVTPVERETAGRPDHVPSPRQNVVEDALAPLFKFPTGRLPVTPEVKGIKGKSPATKEHGAKEVAVLQVPITL
jgi:hypothetical protein